MRDVLGPPYQLAAKMSPGAFMAALVCLAGMPLHLLLSLLIRLSDGGPALYRSGRIGRNGVTFQMVKYRTMKVDSAPIVTAGLKTVVYPADSRVTRPGRLLRCGIDELPQLFNIIRGEMAWIGPRPDEPWMLPKYGQAARQRLSALPGITGLAQILNSRNLGIAEGYAIDVWYLEHRSIWLDLQIVLLTPLFMMGWRSIGESHLQKMRSKPAFRKLLAYCEAEIASIQAISQEVYPSNAVSTARPHLPEEQLVPMRRHADDRADSYPS